MAKLIRSVIDCGHRAHEKCFHSSRKHICDCKPKGESNFPRGCPLEEGMIKQDECYNILCSYKKPKK